MSERTWLARTSWARRSADEGREPGEASHKAMPASSATAAARPARAHDLDHGTCLGAFKAEADTMPPIWLGSWRARWMRCSRWRGGLKTRPPLLMAERN